MKIPSFFEGVGGECDVLQNVLVLESYHRYHTKQVEKDCEVRCIHAIKKKEEGESCKINGHKSSKLIHRDQLNEFNKLLEMVLCNSLYVILRVSTFTRKLIQNRKTKESLD